MSEKSQKPAERPLPPRRHTPPGRIDELTVYGDQEEAPRRSEKSPPPRKKKRKKKRSPVARAQAYAQKLLTRLRGGGESERAPFSFRSRSFLLLAGALVLLMLVYAVFLENRNLSVSAETVTVVGLPSDLEGYRILHLSDLRGRRFGDQQSTLLREIEKLSYDIVIMTGDMVGPSGDAEPLYELLEGLPSRKKVYFICGDSDPGPYVSSARAESGKLTELVLADWILGAMERGAVYVDEPVEIAVGSSKVWLTPAMLMNLNLQDSASALKEQMEQEQAGYISGIQADYQSLPFTSYRYERMQAAYQSLADVGETDLIISLAHVPPSRDAIRSAALHVDETDKYFTPPDLVLAGHYCGGVFRLPVIGAFFVSNTDLARYGWFPAQENVSGLSSVGETQLYISRGFSFCSDAPLMRIRLFNRPEISVLTLTATLPGSMLEE